MFDYIVRDRETPVTLPGGLAVTLSLDALEAAAPAHEKPAARQAAANIRDYNRNAAGPLILPDSTRVYAGVAFSCEPDLTLDFGDRLARADLPSIGLTTRRKLEREQRLKRKARPRVVVVETGDGVRGAKLARRRRRRRRGLLENLGL